MRRKLQLTIETHQLLVIKKARHLTQGWCSECARDVPLIEPEEAAVLPVSVREPSIDGWKQALFISPNRRKDGCSSVSVHYSTRVESNQLRCVPPGRRTS